MALPLIVGPLYMLATVAIVAILFYMKKMSGRIATLVLVASLAVAGFLQWGFLDTTIYLHQVLYGIINGGINPQQAFKVVLILASSLIVGRLFCGYICPIGAAQELASKAIKRQIHIDVKLSEKVRATFFLAFMAGGVGLASLAHFNPFSLVSSWLFTFKLLALIAIVASSLFIYRPWCTLLCPFGLLMSLSSRLSLFRLNRNEKCIDCGACVKKCPTCQPYRGSAMSECYWCARCLKACRHNAIDFATRWQVI
ncbi:4Fe-4S binding protein [Methanocella conradii]|uniref:4Fe-4S binding protein n=1 Tax=Methanocella conradii TaxID=1175444 RepID=UPI0024B32912|nr:4Fe-4S binding protein [Methanocella conradii]MDI6896972.1 4Fe-4S binding protein [Methanocella conradii]